MQLRQNEIEFSVLQAKKVTLDTHSVIRLDKSCFPFKDWINNFQYLLYYNLDLAFSDTSSKLGINNVDMSL